MKTQSCQACSRRKVRCDHGEPCSNCKRRKDDCIYAEQSSAERIKELEVLVRSLQDGTGNTIHTEMPTNAMSHPQPHDVVKDRQESGTNPVMLHEEGESVYVESYVCLVHLLKYTKWRADLHGTAGTPLRPKEMTPPSEHY
jgi:hypothetical protein